MGSGRRRASGAARDGDLDPGGRGAEPCQARARSGRCRVALGRYDLPAGLAVSPLSRPCSPCRRCCVSCPPRCSATDPRFYERGRAAARGREQCADFGMATRQTAMTAVVPGRQQPQVDQLEAHRLDEVAVQRSPVGDRTHQQGVDAHLDALEWRQRGQRERDPARDQARDQESVFSNHVGLLASLHMLRPSE
jgi:hypothetical protein